MQFARNFSLNLEIAMEYRQVSEIMHFCGPWWQLDLQIADTAQFQCAKHLSPDRT